MDQFVDKLMSVIVIIIFGIPMLIRGAYYQNVTPQKVEKRLGIDLPESAVVENYEYRTRYDRLYVKLSISDNELELMQNYLIDYCDAHGFLTTDNANSTFFAGIIDWWDMDENQIELYYYRMIKGKYGLKTGLFFIYMAKDTAGKMCLWFVD